MRSLATARALSEGVAYGRGRGALRTRAGVTEQRKEATLMAIYHCSIKVGSRGAGASACGAAAYRAADKVRDHETGLTHDFQRKSGVVHDEIMLPENAPEEFHNREKLWNAAQAAERQKNGQLYREIEVALPRELTREQQKKLVRDYIRENFTSKGMCADWALHDKGDGNPHAHIMVTMRGIDKNGKWEPKRRDVYANDRDENGKAIYNPAKPGGKENRIPRLDKNGMQKLDKKGARVWERVKVDVNDWNDSKNAELWREAWARECNKYLPIGHKIDHRSFVRRGIDQIPTKHEGFAARQMERRGGIARSCQLNREIRRMNEALHQLELEQRDVIVKIEKARINRELRKMREEIEAIRNYGGGKYDSIDNKIEKDRAGAARRLTERRREKNLIRRADQSDARSARRNPRHSFADIRQARDLSDMPFGGVDSKAARADLLLSDVERSGLEVERSKRMRNNGVQRSTGAGGRAVDGNRIKDIIRKRKAAEKSAVKEQSKRISATADKISSIKQTRATASQSKQALRAGLDALEKGVDFATAAVEKMLPDDAGKLVSAAVKTAKAALNPKNLLPHNTLKVAFDIIGTAAKAGDHNAQAFLHNPGALPDNIKGIWEWMSNTDKAEMLYKMSLRDDMELGTSSFMSNYKPSPAPQREKVRSL